MIVVSDTTPIHYLILIGAVESLKALFGHVVENIMITAFQQLSPPVLIIFMTN